MDNHNPSLRTIQSDFQGHVYFPDHPNYEESRQLWNGMIDKRPAMICQCVSESDVQKVVRFAIEKDMLLAIHGGGHNSAGTASCDDGIMLDLSLMNAVDVNVQDQTVKVQGGCLLGKVDEVTQEHGLAVSSGIISHTGVGGLTLGGGMGWISRKYGLSVDNLLAVRLVTANGEIVSASAEVNSDLFWACRGGGGNFGVVTEFTFKAAPIGKEVYSGPIVKPISELKSYMAFHREYVRQMPDEMTIWFVIRYAPPLPFIPEEYHGQLVLLVPSVYLGDPEEGKALLDPIRNQGTTIGDGTGMHPWVGWQSAFDGLVSHGARNYWKSHHLAVLSDDCIDVIQNFATSMPSDECEVFIPHMEGAPSRVGLMNTAFSFRKNPFVLNIHTRWQNKEDDERCLKWAREFHKATQPFANGVYVNFISDSQHRAKDAYAPEIWNKLTQIKGKWDPQNLFRVNQNIPPE